MHFHGVSTEEMNLQNKYVLGVPVNYKDVTSIDPEYAKNLQVNYCFYLCMTFNQHLHDIESYIGHI